MLLMIVFIGLMYDNILYVKNDFKKILCFDFCVMLLVINNVLDYG